MAASVTATSVVAMSDDGETVAMAAVAAVRLGTLVVIDMVEEREPVELAGVVIEHVSRTHPTLAIASAEPVRITAATTNAIIRRLGGFDSMPSNLKFTHTWLRAQIGYWPEAGYHVRKTLDEKPRNNPPTLADLFGE